MRSVGIKVLNSKLSEYVRLAAAGETVLVTDRDRVVAEIGPPAPARSATVADAHLAELMRTGILTPPSHVGSGAPPKPEPTAPLGEILQQLDRDRCDR
ncbi:type II toxin-antitoxin system Phd/YefM family antitoxin [Candidatus Poriferisodalis sp.]|uniref:type II toxin-antitoxin system Phd/YefM family antitoxin n=1 Tax=Candidatus Poriferisodalis sp. TaxID=3101277 RepID=UPI003B01A1C7